MKLSERIQLDLVSAMKSRDQERLLVLRSIKTALQNLQIEKRAELDDADVLTILQRLKKQRTEAAETFRQGGREELASKEQREQAIIETYLPELISESEVSSVAAAVIAELGASSPKDMGAVMKEAMIRLKATGKTVDGKLVNQTIRAKLS